MVGFSQNTHTIQNKAMQLRVAVALPGLLLCGDELIVTKREYNMTDSKAAQAGGGIFNRLRRHSRQLTQAGQHLLQRYPRDTVSRVEQNIHDDKVIDMKKSSVVYSQAEEKHTPHSLFRQQLPGLTRQLLGKRFNSISKFANFVAPQGSFDMASDQILELLADFASNLAETRKVLDEAGVATLAELQHDVARSGRLSRALGEQNRILAIVQGAISGTFGVVGAAADLPASMIIALRTIYLTGRAYGFELDHPEDRTIVFEALSRVDLSLIAEKQAILLGLRSFGSLLDSGDLQHLQTLLGSNNNIEPLKNLLSDDNGQLKWKLSSGVIRKIAPVLGGVAGAVYNARLIQDVASQAQEVFAAARQDVLSRQAKPEADTILLDVPHKKKPDPEAAQLAAQVHILQSDTIEKVAVIEKAAAQPLDEAAQDKVIHEQIETLAHTLIEGKPAETVKPAAKPRTRKAPAKAAVTAANEPATTDTVADKPVAAKRSRKATGAAATEQAATNAVQVDQPAVAKTPRLRSTGGTKAAVTEARANTANTTANTVASEEKPKAPRSRSSKAAPKVDGSAE